MPVIHEGLLNAQGKKFAIIVTRFNDFLTEKLLAGAVDTIRRHGGDTDSLHVYRAPGCFEIPVLAKKLASLKQFDAIICLGCLIRGDTPHFDYISAECTKGIAQTAMEFGIPVAYGVITTEDLEQAIQRSGAKAGNKGAEAALAAIEMADLFSKIL